MEKEIETIDSPNDETELEVKPEITPEEDEETDSEEVIALKDKNRQLFERAKKAEGFIKQEDGTWVKKPKPEPKIEPEVKKSVQAPDLDKLLDEKLEKRELESLDISDELKKEVQTYAKLNKVSIKKALDSDYIQFQKEKEEKKSKAEDASLGGGRRGTTKKDYANMTASDFDMKTEEGKADFKKWEEHMRKALG